MSISRPIRGNQNIQSKHCFLNRTDGPIVYEDVVIFYFSAYEFSVIFIRVNEDEYV